jgi:hypothetical protein
VRGDTTGLATQLVGGGDPLARLRIHQRHYAAELAELCGVGVDDRRGIDRSRRSCSGD